MNLLNTTGSQLFSIESLPDLWNEFEDIGVLTRSENSLSARKRSALVRMRLDMMKVFLWY